MKRFIISNSLDLFFANQFLAGHEKCLQYLHPVNDMRAYHWTSDCIKELIEEIKAYESK